MRFPRRNDEGSLSRENDEANEFFMVAVIRAISINDERRNTEIDTLAPKKW